MGLKKSTLEIKILTFRIKEIMFINIHINSKYILKTTLIFARINIDKIRYSSNYPIKKALEKPLQSIKTGVYFILI